MILVKDKGCDSQRVGLGWYGMAKVDTTKIWELDSYRAWFQSGHHFRLDDNEELVMGALGSSLRLSHFLDNFNNLDTI